MYRQQKERTAEDIVAVRVFANRQQSRGTYGQQEERTAEYTVAARVLARYQRDREHQQERSAAGAPQEREARQQWERERG